MSKPDPLKIVTTFARLSLVLIALSSTQYSVSLAQGASSGPGSVSEVSPSSPNGTVVSTVDSTYIAQLPQNGSAASAVSQNGTSTAETPIPTGAPENDLVGILTSTAFLAIMVIGLVSLLFLRRRRSKAKTTVLIDDSDDFGFSNFESIETGDKAKVEPALFKANSTNGANGSYDSSAQKKPVVRLPVSMPVSLFGAFQVDQEVAKLVMGQPHKTEVMASRAPDDRRAIEASLLKALASNDAAASRRVRSALEEYGFVARQNAAVLLAADPYDRTSAARMLGNIKSPSSLPYLLEALYDSESIVRNQAVLSIGELRLPAAIGALLDIARTHPDVPRSLLSRALSACSLEGLDFFGDPIPESQLVSTTEIELFSNEVKKLKPASAVMELPESVDDVVFGEALAMLDSLEIAERAEGIKLLAQFAVRNSVIELAQVARRDAKPNLRALAIGSLATINHESVFPSVLIAMADESREVRAAAARALSRLSFDRADAYTRVMETDDAATLREVAQACVKSGVASQALDRLGSSDRRQAYEALTLVSLLAKADVLEPILAAIAKHPSVDVRISAVRLLGTTGNQAVLTELKELVPEVLPGRVQIALAEAIAKLAGANNESRVTTKPEGVSQLFDFEIDEGDPHQPETTSAAFESEQHELDSSGFLHLQDELANAESEHYELDCAGTQPVELRSVENASDDHELDILDLGLQPEEPEDLEPSDLFLEHESQNLDCDVDEPSLTRLQNISEQPRVDTSGLPAPPIA